MSETLHAWRHPRAEGAEGRCIGRTDLRVDARRAKRVAHRIRAFARQQRLPAIVLTSPLERCHAVGRWLARWGWLHRVDTALCELDFGSWDGRPWADVDTADVERWCADFARHRPGGGESVAALLHRVGAFDPGPARIVVTHGGWLAAAAWRASHGAAAPLAAHWPAAPRWAARCALPLAGNRPVSAGRSGPGS